MRWWRYAGLLAGWLLLGGLLAACLGTQPGGVPATPEGDGLWFPATGHWVKPPFVALYRSLPDPVGTVGYPITEAVSLADGRLRQYFQYGVMETNEQGTPALLALGELFYAMDRERAQPLEGATGAGCQQVVPQAPPVCRLFLDFYRRHGGEAVLGPPLSPLVLVDGRPVQYFRTVRLELAPDVQGQAQVRPSPLGERFFRAQGEDLALLRPLAEANLPAALLSTPVRLQAYAPQLALPVDGEGEIYLTVADASGRPVPEVDIWLVLQVRGAEGDAWNTVVEDMRLGSTNAAGVLRWVLRPGRLGVPSQATWMRCWFAARQGGQRLPGGETYLDLRLWSPSVEGE